MHGTCILCRPPSLRKTTTFDCLNTEIGRARKIKASISTWHANRRCRVSRKRSDGVVTDRKLQITVQPLFTNYCPDYPLPPSGSSCSKCSWSQKTITISMHKAQVFYYHLIEKLNQSYVGRGRLIEIIQSLTGRRSHVSISACAKIGQYLEF